MTSCAKKLTDYYLNRNVICTISGIFKSCCVKDKAAILFFWLVGVGGWPLTSHHHVIAPRLSHSSLVICLLSVFHLFRVSSSSPAPITIELPPIQNGRLNVTWQWISTIKQRHNDDDVTCLPPSGHFWQFEFNRRWCQSIETKCNAGDLYFFFPFKIHLQRCHLFSKEAN